MDTRHTTVTPNRRRDRYYVINPAVVRDRRMALRLSVEALADVLGVSPGAIDHLEHHGEQNHLTVAVLVDLARVLGLTVAQLVTEPEPVPGGDGDLVDSDDPATVGRIIADVGTVLVDELADGLGWSLGRTLYALTVLEERLPTVGQRLSWLADSQVTIIHALGDKAPVSAVTRRTITAYGLTAEETALITWIAGKPHGHRSRGQELNPVLINRLTSAAILTAEIKHGPRAKRGEPGEELLRLTDETRYALCLDDD